MRFRLEKTQDGSITLFDAEAGESFKSRHAAATEAEVVFFSPGIRENPWLEKTTSFRILELGFGLGTNLFHSLNAAKDFPGHEFQYFTIERDLSGAQKYLECIEKNPQLLELLEKDSLKQGNFSAHLVRGNFTDVLQEMIENGKQFHCIFFDPFSPKANPEAWAPSLFRLCAKLLTDQGRLVTYSVSRVAKEACSAAGFQWEKRVLPKILQKRNALLATKMKSLENEISESL